MDYYLTKVPCNMLFLGPREMEGQMKPLKSINRGKTITTSAGKYRFDELDIREILEFVCKYVNI